MNWTETWEFDYDSTLHTGLLSQFYQKASDVADARGIKLDGVTNVQWRLSSGKCRVFGTVWLSDDEPGEEE